MRLAHEAFLRGQWGSEYGLAKEMHALVMTCSLAVLKPEKSAEQVAAICAVLREQLPRARKITASYIATGDATPKFQHFAELCELVFQRLEEWAEKPWDVPDLGGES